MSMETKTTLNDDTVNKVQTLIRANIDSSEGFRECADQVKDSAIASLFQDLAVERSAMASTLQEYVALNDKEPEEEGTFLASLHRAWINVRGALSGGDSTNILSEAERGEDSIKGAYEDALKDTAGSAMNDVLQKQYVRIKEGHDRVRDLRDSFKNAK